MDTGGQNIEKLTSNSFDTQIITPCWNPNGREVVFAESGSDGNLDLYTMLIENGEKTQITNSPEGDYLPIWHPSGNKISYTGLYE